MNIDKVSKLVLSEAGQTYAEHGPIKSPHEGVALIREELDELWGELRKIKKSDVRTIGLKKEAIQVAAMALRFVVDLFE